MSDCRGCGAAIAPSGRRGRPRVWCSDACRESGPTAYDQLRAIGPLHGPRRPHPGMPARPRNPRCVDMAGQRFGSLTVTDKRRGKCWVCVCDCGRIRPVTRRELLRYPNPSCGDRRTHARADVVSYGGAHDRLDRDHGLAKTHQCVDCNGPAAHWSYDHADPDELTSPEGYPYSLDAGHYEPRCPRCHARFDQARDRPHYVGARDG